MIRKFIIFILGATVIAVGIIAYAVFRTPEAATGQIEAIPVVVETEAATEIVEPVVTEVATEAVTEPVAQTESAEADTAPYPVPEGNGPIVFQIVPEESQVRFIIDEVLNGAPKTVVGLTDQVAAEIAFDWSDPAATRLGTIQVNARTLVTDNDFRNRALKNQILQTNDFEFITFTPVEIIGLPASVSLNERYEFQIIGEITVREVTREVIFDASVTPISETRLEGSAATTILYADYGITIPQARSVTSVEDEVRLEIDFAAVSG